MGAGGLLARHNLLQERSRLALSAAGVSLSVVLIVLMNGFLVGFDRQVSVYPDSQPASIVVVAGVESRLTAYIDASGADVWVAQEGVRNLHMASSNLPAEVADEWAGRTFHFCSRRCRAELMVDPATFVSPNRDGRIGAAS